MTFNMAHLEFNLQTASIFLVFVWIAWRFLKFVFKDPFNNIPGPPSPSLVQGNIGQLYNTQAWAFHQSLADNYGRVVKYRGMWNRGQLYVSDPKALYNIVVKEQDIYEETDGFIHGNRLMFGEGLLGTLGERHRKQRKMLNPVFSSRHLQDMIPTFYKVSYKLRDALLSKVETGAREIDIVHWSTRTALELIGQSGLGYSFDNLDEGPPHEYSGAIKNLIPTIFKLTVARLLLPSVIGIGSPGFRRSIVKLLPSRTVQSVREMIDMMDRTSHEVLRAKREAMQQGDEVVLKQVGRGKDIMSILLKNNMEASDEDRLPEAEIIAQMTTMVFAATDTTSGALARIFHSLAQHPEAQDRLRKEITDARAKGGDLDYNELSALPYLDAIIRETLRLYCPVPYIDRIARQDVMLPLSTPIIGIDGTKMHEIFVPKGTMLTIAIMNANRDPEIWGNDAQDWVPDRWLSPLPESVSEAHLPGVYSQMMTFLGGSRACIGFKFSQLEMKVIVCLLLESFSFSPSDKEIIWNLGGLITPSLGGGKPQMPLVVTKI